MMTTENDVTFMESNNYLIKKKKTHLGLVSKLGSTLVSKHGQELSSAMTFLWLILLEWEAARGMNSLERLGPLAVGLITTPSILTQKIKLPFILYKIFSK